MGERRTVLETAPLLAGLPGDTVDHLSRRVTDVRFTPGDVILREGSPGREAFLLLDGEVEIRLRGHLVATRAAGDLIGEMALLSHGPRSATVRARTTVRALAIDAADFAQIVACPVVARRLASVVVERLRHVQGSPTWRD